MGSGVDVSKGSSISCGESAWVDDDFRCPGGADAGSISSEGGAGVGGGSYVVIGSCSPVSWTGVVDEPRGSTSGVGTVESPVVADPVAGTVGTKAEGVSKEERSWSDRARCS